jgi:HEAT repeat protein
VSVLIQCLEDPSLHVCYSAANALGTIKQKPEVAVPALIKCLQRLPSALGSRPAPPFLAMSGRLGGRTGTEQTIYVSGAAWALAQFGTNADAAVPELLRHFAGKRKDDTLSYHAAHRMLEALTTVSAHPAMIAPTLASFLESTNQSLRHQAAYCLSVLGPQAHSALPSLSNALHFQSTREVVTTAMRNISSFVPTNTVPERIPSP